MHWSGRFAQATDGVPQHRFRVRVPSLFFVQLGAVRAPTVVIAHALLPRECAVASGSRPYDYASLANLLPTIRTQSESLNK